MLGPGGDQTPTALTWTASTDLGGSTLTSYDVYRDGVLLGAPTPPTALTYTDTGATSPGSYTYTVRALDSAGNSRPPRTRSGRVRRHGPRAPTWHPVGTTPTGQKPVLSWAAATDTGGAGRPLRDLPRGDARGLDGRHAAGRSG